MKKENLMKINIQHYPSHGIFGTYTINDGDIIQIKYKLDAIVFFRRLPEKNNNAVPVYCFPLSAKSLIPHFVFSVSQSKIINKKSLKGDDKVFLFNNYNTGEYELWIDYKLINLTPVGFVKKEIYTNIVSSLRTMNCMLVYVYDSDYGPFENILAYDYLTYYTIFEEYQHKLKEFHYSDTTYESMEEIDKHIELLGQLKVDIANAKHQWEEASAFELFNWLKGKRIITKDVRTLQ